jgi:hypothetical protein
VSHSPGQLTSLRDPDEKNLAEYAVTVHGLKGAAYGICAYEAGSRAEALELAAKAGDLETVRAGNGDFLEFMETLITDLSELLRQAETPRADTPKKRLGSPDEALLQKLLEAAAHFKISQMEEVINELELYEYETGGELVTWLKEQMENLEYDAIRERLA